MQILYSGRKGQISVNVNLVFLNTNAKNKAMRLLICRVFVIVMFINLAITSAHAQVTNITGNTNICAGSSTTLTISGTGPFSWYDASLTHQLSTSATYTTPPLTTSTTFVASANGTGVNFVNVNVKQFPAYKAIASPAVICAGSSSTLSVASANSTVSWYDAPSGGNLLGTGTIQVSPQTTKIYYATLTGTTSADSVVFSFTGNVQTFTVPAGVYSINVDVKGARGGYVYEENGTLQGSPGLGGRVRATMSVTPGQVLYIYVGESGHGYGTYKHPAYNGGGATYTGLINGYYVNFAGGGGGASDIRVRGQALTDRWVVAGGGGGAGDGSNPSGNDAAAGAGGGLAGGDAEVNYGRGFINAYPGSQGLGGTQSAGGTGGSNAQFKNSESPPGVAYSAQNGSAGKGGDQAIDYSNDNGNLGVGGGGGGGYYGGGGGTDEAGGGGGSSYIFIPWCQNVINEQGVQNGDGQVTISYNTGSNCTASLVLADTVTVNPLLTPTVSITASVCPSCGTIFTATAVNGGPTPVYTWYKNNVVVGANSPVYSDNGLTNSDNIYCTLSATGTCLTTNTATSNTISATGPLVNAISPSSGPPGTLVTITGSHLETLSSLSIAGVPAILLSNIGTQVTAMIMPGATTGAAAVTTLFGTSTGGNFTLTAASPPGVQQGGELTGGATPGNNLYYGSGVAISADGNTAVVGISGDNSGAGGAIVYTRSNGNWTQQGNELVGTGATGNAAQGNSVALSADGNTALVGGSGDNTSAGAAWVFVRSNGAWSQQGNKLTCSDGSAGAQFGYSVSLSADGNTAMIGGLGDNGNLGAGWIFNRVNGVWAQNGSKLVGTGAINTAEVYMGNSVAMSADGNTAVLGGKYDNARTGAIWVFTNTNGTWTQQGSKLLASDAISSPYGPELGCSVAVSADGNTIFSGGSRDNNFLGAAWVFTRSGGVWTQQGAKLLGTGIQNPGSSSIYFGDAVSLSADGNTAIVAATADNNYTGAMWVFSRSNGAWTQRGNKLTGTGEVPFVGVPNFGKALALSYDGSTALAGSQYDNTTIGAAWVFVAPQPALLSGLALNAGTLKPTFSPTTTSYTASVGNTITNITVTPTMTDATATIKVNGTTVASGTASAAIPLSVGANAISIITTLADGVTTKTYTVTVTRAQSGNDNLSALSIHQVAISPAFLSHTNAYTATVANASSSIVITATASEPNAIIKINGVTTASGTPSSPVAVNVGDNTITIAVTAQNGANTLNYTIDVTRKPSTNDALTTLQVKPFETITKTTGPDFGDYTVSVPNNISSIAVIATASDPTATITVNGTATPSGATSGAVALSVGVNTVTTKVMAQDGINTRNYVITVTRAPSSNAILTKLSTSPVETLTAVTGTGYKNYTASVANTVTLIKVFPVTEDPTATVKVNGTTVASGSGTAGIHLVVGSNTLTTVVTAQDGVTMNSYIITMTRAAAGSTNIPDDQVAVALTSTPTLNDDGILVHQAVSPNGDGVNDYLTIENIASYPDNKLMIMNPGGALVYEAKGYDNQNKVFDGHSNKTGQMQLPGTYFYSLDYTVKGVLKHKTGFLVLKY
jgi:gliding motility-associated-like protein